MCGILGQINKRQSKFNYSAFTTLGIVNDSRGGDSCGIFIDGNVEYGVNDKKLFSDFYKSSKLLNETDKCLIALGHCRKASVGVIDEEHAQPVVIKEDGEVKFVVMHNGTIYNYESLAKKYIPEIDIKGMTDSQVMAHIFYHAGYSCLSEYNGGAVFVIIDYREKVPAVFLFKGKSRIYNTSVTESEERPFYFIYTNSGILFSSIGAYLPPFSKGNELMTISSNTLCKVEDGEIYYIEEYPRTNCIQTKEYQIGNYGLSTYGKVPYYDDYDDYANYYNDYYKNKSIVEKMFDSVDINCDGLYVHDGKLMQGSFSVSPDGYIGYSNTAKQYWFWNGVLLKNRECYKFLKNFCKKSGLSEEDIATTIPFVLDYFSMFPCFMHTSEGDPIVYTCPTIGTQVKYTGKFQVLGDDIYYVVKDGEIEEMIPSKSSQSIIDFYYTNLNFKFDSSEINAEIIRRCNLTK